ncbi:hypothetical protein PAGU2196_23150 [Pseudomonas sp. PAGU 2196]|uniref:hypothetical protein n=1 Tax=Pseudomonas sp. PAGU 2196 TaxID=2793997 RepID=UPI001EE11226|nr:hypothetical protein [Pseudomonas sp. PAGU 2196]GHS81481.1 hypothetical protein PAGU2196_23150 [Pseudomonas sp. PAGU 2196]
MTNTLSAMPVLPLPTVALFDRFGKPIKPAGPNEELAKHRAAVRQARHAAELEAIEYAQIMLQRHIAAALDPATDPKLARQLRLDIMDRGIGKVREAESDSDPKQREAAAQNMLEALAAMSTSNFALEQQGKAAAFIERDVTPEQGQYQDIDLDQFNVENE